MKNRSSIMIGTLVVLTVLLLFGCGGGGSDGGTSSDNGVIQGVASKGIIDDATVTAYAVNEDGTRGPELGSAQTNVYGEYSLDIGDYDGPVIIEVTGGSYTDEATGETVANETLRAIIPQLDGSKKVAVTPLTELAVQIVGETYDATQINNANAAVSVLIGGADVVETQPQDIDGDLSGATEDEKNYTILLAVVSQMIESGDAVDVAEAITKIKADLEDDGQIGILVSDTLIQEGKEMYEGFQEDNTGFVGKIIQTELANFLASDENNTGLTMDDISLDEELENAAVKFILAMEEHEYDGDDTYDERYTYTYDANGNTSIFTQDGDWADDILIDDTVDYIINYTYDADNRIVREDRDYTGNGAVNYRKDFNYDVDGNLILIEIDSNADDIYTYFVSYEYDANGNNTLVEYDTNGDDTIDLTYNSTYDANDNKTQEERIYSGVLKNRYTWTYDASGKRISFESDGSYSGPAPDGIADVRYTYEYDENGKVIRQDSDTNADGEIDMVSYYTYNADGNRIMAEYDDGASGVIDERVSCTYDDYGNRTLCETDNPIGGVIDQSTKYTWTQL